MGRSQNIPRGWGSFSMGVEDTIFEVIELVFSIFRGVKDHSQKTRGGKSFVLNFRRRMANFCWLSQVSVYTYTNTLVAINQFKKKIPDFCNSFIIDE